MGSGHVHEAPLAGSAPGRLDARAKLLAIVPAIVVINAIPVARWPALAGVVALFTLMLSSCGRGAAVILRRSLALLPFVLFVAVTLPFSIEGTPRITVALGPVHLVASDEGLRRAAETVLRAAVSIVGLLVLSGTTEPSDLFRGLAALRTPRAFVLVLSMVYRYLFLLSNELSRLRRGASARGFVLRRSGGVRRLGAMAGALLVRSVVRAEHVRRAMSARGFDGTLRTLPSGHFGSVEVLFLVVWYAVLTAGVVAAFHA